MKKNISIIALVVVFVIGLSVLLYPSISDLFSKKEQASAISGYRDQVGVLREEEYAKILDEARAYNANHRTNNFSVSDEEALTPEYMEQLSLNGSSLMAYLEIPKFGTRLGVYHGVSEQTMEKGIGHLPQTSLPVGGTSTHAVISGHTGLPSAQLLSDLDTLEIGDTFKLHILAETLEYEVDQILVVEPDDVRELKVVEGEDYVTIITCTPYGVNSHRLLVRGHAVELSSDEAESDAKQLKPMAAALYIAVPILVILSVVLVVVFIRHRKKTAE